MVPTQLYKYSVFEILLTYPRPSVIHEIPNIIAWAILLELIKHIINHISLIIGVELPEKNDQLAQAFFTGEILVKTLLEQRHPFKDRNLIK